MSEPFIAEVRIWSCNFAPRGWSFCDGQELPIAQNTALFSLIGTTYGGDGRLTVGLPNMQGKTPMHPGRVPGLTPRRLGEFGGSETLGLTESQIPAHTHQLAAAKPPGDEKDPDYPAPAADRMLTGLMHVETRKRANAYVMTPDGKPFTPMAANALSAYGRSEGHLNTQPYLGLNFCIALVGLYPSRS